MASQIRHYAELRENFGLFREQPEDRNRRGGQVPVMVNIKYYFNDVAVPCKIITFELKIQLYKIVSMSELPSANVHLANQFSIHFEYAIVRYSKLSAFGSAMTLAMGFSFVHLMELCEIACQTAIKALARRKTF